MCGRDKTLFPDTGWKAGFIKEVLSGDGQDVPESAPSERRAVDDRISYDDKEKRRTERERILNQ